MLLLSLRPQEANMHTQTQSTEQNRLKINNALQQTPTYALLCANKSEQIVIIS